MAGTPGVLTLGFSHATNKNEVIARYDLRTGARLRSHTETREPPILVFEYFPRRVSDVRQGRAGGGWEWLGREDGQYVWNAWDIFERVWRGPEIRIRAFTTLDDASPLAFERSRDFVRWEEIPITGWDERLRVVPLLPAPNYGTAQWAQPLLPDGKPPEQLPWEVPIPGLTAEQLRTLWDLKLALGFTGTVTSPPAPTEEPREPAWWRNSQSIEFYRVRYAR